jgi:hypothetical protein
MATAQLGSVGHFGLRETAQLAQLGHGSAEVAVLRRASTILSVVTHKCGSSQAGRVMAE